MSEIYKDIAKLRQELHPEAEPPYRHERLMALSTCALGGIALASLTYFAAVPGRDELVAFATPDSSTEKLIEKTLEAVVDTDIRVDCIGRSRITFAHMIRDEYSPNVSGWNMHNSVYGRSKTIHLMPDICEGFAAFPAAATSGFISYEQNEAVNIATHEALHASGIHSEAKANCYAIQLSEQTALELGADSVQATEVRRVAATLTNATLPDKYHSAECRPGGAYDLGLRGNDTFPLQNTFQK